jgi:hypothetical protein
MAGTSPPPQGIAHVCIPSVKQMDIKRMKRYDSKASWGRQLRSFLCLTIEQLVQIEGCVFASCHQATSGCAFPTHLPERTGSRRLYGDHTETKQRLYRSIQYSHNVHVFPCISHESGSSRMGVFNEFLRALQLLPSRMSLLDALLQTLQIM